MRRRPAIRAIFAAARFTAYADTIYSTFGPGQSYFGGGLVLASGNLGIQVPADSFVPTETATLTDAELALSRSAPVNVYIESDSGGVPGVILDTLTQVGSLSSTSAVVKYNCSSCPQLDAGTTYFLLALASNPCDLAVWYSEIGQPLGANAINDLGSATGPWSTRQYRAKPVTKLADPHPAVSMSVMFLRPIAYILTRNMQLDDPFHVDRVLKGDQ